MERGEERGQEVGVQEQVEEEPALARVGEAWVVVLGQVGQVGRIHSPGPHLLEQIRFNQLRVDYWSEPTKKVICVSSQTILLCIECES